MLQRDLERWAVVALCLATLACGSEVSATVTASSEIGTPFIDSSTSEAVWPTNPPPLREVAFPTQEVAYPTEWPADLRYSDSLMAVDLASEALPNRTGASWLAKLRFAGTASDAADDLSATLTGNGWLLMERIERSGGGIVILARQGDGLSEAVAVVDTDPDDPNQSLVFCAVLVKTTAVP